MKIEIVQGCLCTCYTNFAHPLTRVEYHLPFAVQEDREISKVPGNGNLEAGKPHEGPIEAFSEINSESLKAQAESRLDDPRLTAWELKCVKAAIAALS
jgi:hypothetical protein